ncbi:MAG: hypothetical protein ACOVNZ_04710 [Crocinitomicaceae bacterium]
MKKLYFLLFLMSSFSLFSQKTTKQLLQGKWQSTEDKKNIVWFVGDIRKESGDGKTWDSEAYTLSNQCENESDLGNKLESTTGNFISCMDSDMCWEILSVNATTLTLIYTGRGNTLTYKKIK